MERFPFDPSNRAGELTSRQRDALSRALRARALERGVWAGMAGALLSGIVSARVLSRLFPAVSDSPLALAVFGGSVLACAVGCNLAASWVIFALWRARLARDAPLGSDSGRVSWSGRRYTAQAGGRDCWSPFGDLQIVPGPYVFYSLRGTRCLVAVEKIGDAHVSHLRAALQSASPLSPDRVPGDAIAEGVDVYEGRLSREVDREPGAGVSYHWRGRRFRIQVGRPAFEALVAGRRYRVCYTRESRALVSIEPLES